MKYRLYNMNVTLLRYNGSTITRVPPDVLSTDVIYGITQSTFVYNFYSGVNFCGKILFCVQKKFSAKE